MKKYLILTVVVCILTSASFAADEPTQKVLNAFQKTFDKAENVVWQERENSNYEASFSHNEMTCRVLYDADGNVLKTFRYHDGKALPIIIQGKISSKYATKKVFGVTEISTPEEVKYQIVLEVELEFIHLSSDAMGNMRVEKKFKKG